MESFSLNEINSLLGTVKNLYDALILKGLYLPKETSSIITSKYLYGVLNGDYYSVKQEGVKIGASLM